MSSLKIEVFDNTGALIQGIEVAIRGVSNWQAFWQDKNGVVSNAWAESRRVMFLTEGRSTGANWPRYTKLERKYYVPVKKWVLGFPQKSQRKVALLRYTSTPSNTSPNGMERLYPSMVSTGNKYYVYRVNNDTATMGTSLPYAANHNNGTGSWTRRWGKKKRKTVTVPTPQRKLVMLSKTFSNDVRNAMIRTPLVKGGKVGLTSGDVLTRFGMNPNGFVP